MIEKKFLNEIKKGKEANLDGFKGDTLDLLEWAIGSSFIEGVSYSGFGNNITINLTDPRLTETGKKLLESLDGEDQEENLTQPYNVENLMEKVLKLNADQQLVVETLVDNVQVLDEITSLDEETIASVKGLLLKLRIEDSESKGLWDIIIKLTGLLK